MLAAASPCTRSSSTKPMHQETLVYMLHRLPLRPEDPPGGARGGAARRRAAGPADRARSGRPRDARGGPAARSLRLGQRVSARCEAEVDAFDIDVDNVTNRDFLEFVEAGGYADETLWDEEGWPGVAAHEVRHPLFWELHRGVWLWRGMWDRCRCRSPGPLYVSHAEASAFARWKARRLPTEAEFHRAAYGTPDGDERTQPWGDAPPDATRGHFDFAGCGPGAGRLVPARRERVGRARSRRQRVGVDLAPSSRRFPGSRRCRPTRSTPPTSSTASTTS